MADFLAAFDPNQNGVAAAFDPKGNGFMSDIVHDATFQQITGSVADLGLGALKFGTGIMKVGLNILSGFGNAIGLVGDSSWIIMLVIICVILYLIYSGVKPYIF